MRSRASMVRSVGSCLLVSIGLSTLLCLDAQAVRTRFFRTEGYPSLKKGELEGTALHEERGIVAAPAVSELSDPGARTVWALAVDEAGRVFASTGDQGQVFRSTDGRSFDLFASLHNYELFALAADGQGGCYAGGAPSGAVTHVNAQGVAETIFDAPEGLVLALLPAPSGGVYVAAGERGRLYFVSESGEAKVVCESGDSHLRCLAWSSDGTKIVAGTDGRGLVQEIDPATGSVRILYDAKEDEIVALVVRPDGVLFAANPGDGNGEPVGDADADEESVGRGPSPAVYWLQPAGNVRPLWRCSERTIHDLLDAEDGGFHVATGDAGALYHISRDAKETILWRAREDQVTSLVAHDDRLYAATGTPGRIHLVGPESAREGRYSSEVLDGGDLVRFGQFRWTGEGEGSVTVRTRSGFTAAPDETWSDWSAESSTDGAQIAAPPGRYLQWQAIVRPSGGDRPVSIRRVEMAYLGTNRPPQLASLSISSDEPSFHGSNGKGGSFSQTLPSGVEVDYSLPTGAVAAVGSADVPAAVRQLRAIAWEASDPDGDDLVYRVEIRRLGEDSWRLVEREAEQPAYALETGLLPDGSYEIRVTASDAPGNPPGTESEATRTTPPFLVDNLAPTVSDLAARRVEGPALVVSGLATDERSPLRRLAVSIDGKSFRSLPPADGLIDSRSERFEATVPLEHDESGNWIVVRAQDSAGNQGSYRAWLETE